MPLVEKLTGGGIDHLFDPILDWHWNNLTNLQKSGHYKSLNSLHQLREYGTVRLDVGRQVGKSRYIARTASLSDIIICRDDYRTELMKQCIAASAIGGCPTIIKADVDIPPGLYSTVWVDDTSEYAQATISMMYHEFAGICTRIVFMG